MSNSFVVAYVTISVILALVDLQFARMAFKRPGKTGKYLGLSAVMAAIVNISYPCSAVSANYLNVSIASSLYFMSIDWLLVFLMHFAVHYTGDAKSTRNGIVRKGIIAYAIFDSAVLAINIFFEIAISYVPDANGMATYIYDMKPLYIAHLVFTYLLVMLVLAILARKLVKVPRQYRNQYLYIVLAIALVVAVNAAFLFSQSGTAFTTVDWSIWGYSIGLLLMFWGAFYYRERNMLESMSMMVFENIAQGIVLFDYDEKFIMRNEAAADMLSQVPFGADMDVDAFLTASGIADETTTLADSFTIQSSAHSGDVPLRCDFRRLKDEAGKAIGNLFVFSDMSNDTDLLTGFQHWNTFRKLAAESPWSFDHPTAVAVFDIVGLGEVNRTFGREVGDSRIRNLVRVMRTTMPAGTYFVRGYEAHLIAVCHHLTEDEMAAHVAEVARSCGENVMYGMSSTADGSSERARQTRETSADGASSTLARWSENRNVLQAIESASRSMGTKKLLNADSVHSQALTSLVRALQESDGDTEAHVKRTRKMGELLGRRIGLNDSERADLNLLCLLHDIGKIGIPLEILNKPGKLTDEEWVVMRSHVNKGYQIAMTSDELKPIADMILYHHERWDGRGYPEGLAGNGIPVLSRVISVVDAYDAMVNTRSYRKAMSPEAAKQEIERCAGSQFDPFIAHEFLIMLDENPEVALGEKTIDDTPRVRQMAEGDFARAGGSANARPLNYSRHYLDVDDNIIDIDAAFEKMTGYSQLDIQTRRMSQVDLIPPEDQTDYVVLVNEQLLKHRTVFIEHDVLRKDGGVIHVYCHGRRYFDSASKSFRSEVVMVEVEPPRDGGEEPAIVP